MYVHVVALEISKPGDVGGGLYGHIGLHAISEPGHMREGVWSC